LPVPVRIDSATGTVTGLYDVSALSSHSFDAAAAEGTAYNAVDIVPNGIAFDAATGRFSLTGKLWAHSYVVALGDGPGESPAAYLAVFAAAALLLTVLVFSFAKKPS
jgi:hypothetical protein